jgi:hypothetical protein
MPPDFPAKLYESVQQRVSVDLGESYPEPRKLFAGGWNAVRYRYLACAEHDQDFTCSIQQERTHLERYHQERDLFGFFVTGLSTIESLCFALHAIGSIVKPNEFPIGTEQDLKEITPASTARRFAKSFQGDPLTTALKQLTKSQDFIEWSRLRNILAHRATPGRAIYVGGPQDGRIEWADISLDHEATSSRRTWLSGVVLGLLEATDRFTAKYLERKA